MERIQAQTTDTPRLAFESLAWVAFAKRPLTVPELREALAVKPHTMKLDTSKCSHIDLVIEACAGLLTVDTMDDTVRLTHQTAQEYLQRTQERWFPLTNIAANEGISEPNSLIVERCLTYLSYELLVHSQRRRKLGIPSHLSRYAATNWRYHVSSQASNSHSILGFLRRTPQMQASASFNKWRDYGYPGKAESKLSESHLTAHFGLVAVTTELPKAQDRAD